MITVLTGGGGGAKFLQGLSSSNADPTQITAIVNTGDDLTLHGLKICPDLDSVIYYLSDNINTDVGWGVADESFTVMTNLDRLNGETWFRLGDKDLATHLYRTQRFQQGAKLSEVTKEIAQGLGIDINVVPMSDDTVSTIVTVDLDSFEHRELISQNLGFQEYFVKYACSPKVLSIRFGNADTALPTIGLTRAINESDLIILGPSNPFLSIDPILSITSIRETIQSNVSKVVAISPIVDGKAIKGPLSKLLGELGVGSDVVSVAKYLRPIASSMVIDRVDENLKSAVEDLGYRVAVTDTVMKNKSKAVELANFVLNEFYL